MRGDGRAANQLRPVEIVGSYIKYAEGSVLIGLGDTRVVCTATVEDRVPPFLKGTGKGWVTAEYGMLPRATAVRGPREGVKGRNLEIQRFIGRALRAVVDLPALGERTVVLDCDVLQADGGTRTAAVTGGFVALVQALGVLVERKELPHLPVRDFVAAVSVGRVDGNLLLDLCFEEDSRADVDCNVVMTGGGEYVEVQGAGEEGSFTLRELQAMLELAWEGIRHLVERQRC
ncbi:MAG: ribonuclease PH, partial [Firmicutes bacterium]|nr:ribonuclease PH [Bacillota bacterium]